MLGTVFAWLYASASRSCPSTQATASNRANPDTLDNDVPAAMIAALRAERRDRRRGRPGRCGACYGVFGALVDLHTGQVRRAARTLTCQSRRAAGREHR